VRRLGLSTTPRDGAASTLATPPPAAATPPNANTAGCGAMMGGEGLTPGQGQWSCDGGFHLIHQRDGNLVLHDLSGRALWNTRTNGQSTGIFAKQGDGNLVL